MRAELLPMLACPSCHGELGLSVSESRGDVIVTGALTCASCGRDFPIVAGIPRFVPRENYAESFGLQWNRFRAQQIDSINGTRLSHDRFYRETGWAAEWMAGKWILELGCGAGRFLDVASGTSAEVVGLDLSNAVDAAQTMLGDRPNLHLVQGSIFELPFRPVAFDGCYAIGVLQHTPDPPRAAATIGSVLKPGGRAAVTVYERRRTTPLFSKYLLRPITRRLPPRLLLFLITVSMPVLFPLTEILFRIPVLKRLFQFIIPVANYVDNKSLSLRQRYQWALLDTFDMLAPRYDLPQTRAAMEEALGQGGLTNIVRLGNPGLNLVGEKPPA